ncbi:MAG: hypothetical protein EYC62_07975 [Alphaproteobacteria bacterium]|nr:MAG: hypothetical protein EYC62_07975 [Alphaproteobacteria bacterium]
MTASTANAENARPVWNTDYSNNQPQSSDKVYVAPAPMAPAPTPYTVQHIPPNQVRNFAPRVQGSADAAWARQWGPIQEMTGINSGQAKQFITGVKQGYVEGTAKTLSSAQDWALILGQSGLVGTVTDSTTDWFHYVTSDLPGAIYKYDNGVNNNLMGGLSGFGNYPGMKIGE